MPTPKTPKRLPKTEAPPVQLHRSHCIRAEGRRSALDQRRNVWYVLAEYWDDAGEHDYRFGFEIEPERANELDIPFRGTPKELAAKRYQQRWAQGHKGNKL